MAAKIRPVYCGNFEYDARQSEIERLFKEYGRVERVDMKTGKFDFALLEMLSMIILFCFVWDLAATHRELLRVGFVLWG